MWSQTSELLNAMLDELAVTYADERERLLQGAFASRVNTVREILDGGGGVAQSSDCSATRCDSHTPPWSRGSTTRRCSPAPSTE